MANPYPENKYFKSIFLLSSKLYVFQISDKYTFYYKYVFIPMAMENNNSSVNDDSRNHNHNRNNERAIDQPPPVKGQCVRVQLYTECEDFVAIRWNIIFEIFDSK